MHDSQFACSRIPWTFGERKELERRANEILRLSRKSGLSTNDFADQSGIPRAAPVRETRRGIPGNSFYGSTEKEGFRCGYSAEPAREDTDSSASGKGPRGKRVANRVAESMSGMPGHGFSVCTTLKAPGDAGADGVPGRRAVCDHPENGDIRLPAGAFYRSRGRRKAAHPRYPAACPGRGRIGDRPADTGPGESSGHREKE